eukprot:CAMPEP_0172417088 /NCGR_PEP_ID=MMETSP1064-20121228/3595_1 /TAXON_ID=202472 /ORGANISM="Aulacoseira subarctica , Strain CCAP 1002/5" /LENGTH=59 /DNA_ID=CAMNT_0013155181 /DNA_START=544 /DNA_END=723 /DNA_ORIENTATION=-
MVLELPLAALDKPAKSPTQLDGATLFSTEHTELIQNVQPNEAPAHWLSFEHELPHKGVV